MSCDCKIGAIECDGDDSTGYVPEKDVEDVDDVDAALPYTCEKIQQPDGTAKEVRTYNRKPGNMNTVGFYTRNGALDRVENYIGTDETLYRVDEFKDGVICKETWFRLDKTIEKTVAYEGGDKTIISNYDEQGKMISSIEYVKDKLHRVRQYFFNDDTVALKERVFNPDRSSHKTAYDDKGRWRWTMEYDKYGRKTVMTHL